MSCRATAIATAIVIACTATTMRAQAAASRFERAFLVRSGDRVSLIIEMTAEPRQVAIREDGTTVEIDAGPVSGQVAALVLDAPAGVPLVQKVAIARPPATATPNLFVRARVTLRAPARSHVRVVGRRVYIDFAPPPRSERVAAIPAAVRPSPNPDLPAPPPASASAQGSAAQYRSAVRPAFTRLAEIQPFLLSAMQSPTPDVLSVLDQELGTLHDSLRTMDVAAESASAHGLLISAVVLARGAVAPGFAGDRAARVREAIGLYDTARAQVDSTP